MSHQGQRRPRKFDYIPGKDIAGDYIVDVTYGAIAGLDPNRGLIFALQAVGAGLIAKSTARRTLPMDLNLEAEEREIQLEQMDDSFAASLAAMPQALPQMVMGGMDPRELVLQLAEVRDLIQKGKAPHEAAKQVFAPKEAPQPQVDPMAEAMAAAQGGDPAALPGQGGGGASDLLMTLAGMSPSGNPQMSATVSRYSEI